MLQGHRCFVSKLDPFHPESNHTKIQLLNQLEMTNLWLTKDKRFCSAAWNAAVLQDPSFVSRIDSFHLETDHAKFQLNLLGNG